MGFDIFQSRRNYNICCRWWSRAQYADIEEDELVYNRVPSGTFWAKEVNAEATTDNVIGGVFMLERTTVTIKSPDDLSPIKSKDLVEYQGEKWVVVSVQKSKAKVQNTYYAEDKNCSHFWYLELRK